MVLEGLSAMRAVRGQGLRLLLLAEAVAAAAAEARRRLLGTRGGVQLMGGVVGWGEGMEREMSLFAAFCFRACC